MKDGRTRLLDLKSRLGYIIYDIAMLHEQCVTPGVSTDHFSVCVSADTPQFRGGNPYFFSENLYQSVSFIYASMYSENVHAIQIAMQFTKNRDIV